MSFAPEKIRVGVLRGGPSAEYEVSLKTGGTILANLDDRYEPIDVFITRDGTWHIKGLQKDPYAILKTIDVAVNALHGSYGEDGKVQKLLEEFGVPYTGSGALASAVGMNKVLAKDIFQKAGLKTPHHIVVNVDDVDIVEKINKSLPFPIIVKPINSGSSLGVGFVDKATLLKKALEESFAYSPKLLVEEYISGKEATCGVIEGFRDTPFYTLLPVEILKGKNKSFHDYGSKYENLESKYNVPGNFTPLEISEIKNAASLVHQSLGLRHYSRSDLILHPRRGLFVLEVNTLPELTHRSPFIKSLEALGGNIKEFLAHIIQNTLHSK